MLICFEQKAESDCLIMIMLLCLLAENRVIVLLAEDRKHFCYYVIVPVKFIFSLYAVISLVQKAELKIQT